MFSKLAQSSIKSMF
ncbi:TPA: hypothetical protein ACOSBD_000727 [Escherichia coli]|nr:hypothetical protein [Escherichia coli]MDA2832574.1 hypothetical protein [Escherichia coli]MDD8418784.1 hypothetical protein [Escherichia coli]